jgi:hypothetical protein
MVHILWLFAMKAMLSARRPSGYGHGISGKK